MIRNEEIGDLGKEIDKQRAIENKQKEIDDKKQLRELKKLEAEKKSSECKKSGRAIIQMDDNGTILKEYETIASVSYTHLRRRRC